MAALIGGDDSGGNPHVDLSAQHALPTEPIRRVWVCVVIHENGGEGIYGQMMGSLMVNFTTENERRKEQMDAMLLRQGTYEVCKRLGKKIEWREYVVGP